MNTYEIGNVRSYNQRSQSAELEPNDTRQRTFTRKTEPPIKMMRKTPPQSIIRHEYGALVFYLHWYHSIVFKPLLRSCSPHCGCAQLALGLNGVSAFMSSINISGPKGDELLKDIDDLLGWGWGYDEWKSTMRSKGYTWNENLKNMIIKREFELFRNEYLRLLEEPNTAEKGKDVPETNSINSTTKRLQGAEWAKGHPCEKEWRLQNRRLLGKDAKVRSAQNYVKEWKNSELSGATVSSADGDIETRIAELQETETASSSQPENTCLTAKPSVMSRSESMVPDAVFPPAIFSSSPIPHTAPIQQAQFISQQHVQTVGWYPQNSSLSEPHAAFDSVKSKHSNKNVSTLIYSQSDCSNPSCSKVHTFAPHSQPLNDNNTPIDHNASVDLSATTTEYSTSSNETTASISDWQDTTYPVEAYDTAAQLEWMAINGDIR